MFGPDVLIEVEEKVTMIQDRLRAAQSRQKSHYDKKRRELSFQPSEYAYLRVSPLKKL